MTQRVATVTEHLQAARQALSDKDIGAANIMLAQHHIDAALEAVQLMRCDAAATLDRL